MTTLAVQPTATVYQARNIVNGHRYIGFTTQGFEKRVEQHRYYARAGKKYYFQHAIAKYGEENFIFGVLADFGEDIELARIYEREAIEKYQPEYNLMLGGDAHAPSLETRAKISAAHKGRKWSNRPPVSDETRAKLSAAMKGKASAWMTGRSPNIATRAKISAAHKGHINYNTKPVSEETRRKLSEKLKGRKPWNTGLVFDETRRKRMGDLRKAEHARATPERKETQKRLGKHLSDVLRKPIVCLTDGLIHESAAAAGCYYGSSKACITGVLKGRYKSARGRVFKYLDQGA